MVWPTLTIFCTYQQVYENVLEILADSDESACHSSVCFIHEHVLIFVMLYNMFSKLLLTFRNSSRSLACHSFYGDWSWWDMSSSLLCTVKTQRYFILCCISCFMFLQQFYGCAGIWNESGTSHLRPAILSSIVISFVSIGEIADEGYRNSLCPPPACVSICLLVCKIYCARASFLNKLKSLLLDLIGF